MYNIFFDLSLLRMLGISHRCQGTTDNREDSQERSMDLKEVQVPSENGARVIKVNWDDNIVVPLCPDFFKEVFSDALPGNSEKMVLSQNSCF